MRHKGSVGLIMTQLATDELISPRDEGYRDMIAVSLAGRAGNPDAVGQLFVPGMSAKAGIIQLFYYIIGAGEDRRRYS